MRVTHQITYTATGISTSTPFLTTGGFDGPLQVVVYAPQSPRRPFETFVEPGHLRAEMARLLLDSPDTEGYLREVARPAAVSPRRFAADALESGDYPEQVEDQRPEEQHYRERRKYRQENCHVIPPVLDRGRSAVTRDIPGRAPR